MILNALQKNWVSVYSTYYGYITLGRNWANIFNWCKELQIIFSPKGSECNFAIREFGKVQGQAWSNNHLKSFYCLSDRQQRLQFLKNLNMSVKWVEKRLNLVEKTSILFVCKNYQINYYAYFSKVDLTKA